MYMSYCRFEGTEMELNACIGTVCEHINEEAQCEVSDREIECFKRMVHLFVDFLNDAELLAEDGDLDEVALDDICDKMREKWDYEEDY